MRDHQTVMTRRGWMAAVLGALIARPASAQVKFRRVPNQYIAALGPASASSGTGAETWGLWREDPGPRGVWLRLYQTLRRAGNIAPAGWRFDINDWWLDENGLIMKAPEFPMPPGHYLVTNGEGSSAILTVQPPDADGVQGWRLSDGARLRDVTHEKCRSARYRPEVAGAKCTPENADQRAFPLGPGEDPPPVADCSRKVYQVLIVYGLPATA